MKVFIGCGSKEEIDDIYKDSSRSIADKLSKMGFDLIIGGNNSGLLKEVASTFRNNNHKVCVNSMKSYNEDNIDIVNHYDNTFERGKMNYYMADYLLFLPGGIGTLSELFAFLEEKRTKNDPKDIIIYNFNNYYVDTISLITKMVTNKFNDVTLLNDIKVFNREEDLINYFEKEIKHE